MNIIDVGQIEVNGDIIACDPCRHEINAWYNTVIKNMLSGIYNVRAILFDNSETGGWGKRVSEIIIQHKDYDTEEFVPEFRITDKKECVGVDSGTACFANLAQFKKVAERDSFDALDELYAATENDKQAGIYDNIAICSSGYGDGTYDVYVNYNTEEKIVSASIVFILEP